MKNFIIFNSEKEGSCALVERLKLFKKITIISDYIEPFDRHMFVNNQHASGKDISKEDFLKCLSLIYNSPENYLEELNRIYRNYNSQTRFMFSKDACRGFKMRLRKHWEPELFSLLKTYNVTAFVLIRQDVLRWALSKYHGDGTGRKGHLQFSHVTNSELPKMKVQWKQLRQEVKKCQRRIKDKKKLLRELHTTGVEAFPLYYEDFCNKKTDYFKNLFTKLDLTITDREIQKTIDQDSHFKKVHSHEISEFVENHEYISKKFEDYMLHQKAWEVVKKNIQKEFLMPRG